MAINEDKGAPQSPPWTFGMLGLGAAAAGDVVTELSSFTNFQQRVDELIRTLKGSPAGPGEVGQERLPREHFGGGAGAFTEASGLYTSYETVITELERLSALLSDSMEGMGIAVLASHKGYENIDADVRKRMIAISAEAKKHYGGDYTPEQTHPGPKSPSGGDAGGTI